MRYEVSFSDYEIHIVKDYNTALQCAKYLIQKWKIEKGFEHEMVRLHPVPDEQKLTWPEEDKED